MHLSKFKDKYDNDKKDKELEVREPRLAKSNRLETWHQELRAEEMNRTELEERIRKEYISVRDKKQQLEEEKAQLEKEKRTQKQNNITVKKPEVSTTTTNISSSPITRFSLNKIQGIAKHRMESRSDKKI